MRVLATLAAMVVVSSHAAAADAYTMADVANLTCVQADKRLTEGLNAGSAEAAYTIAQMMARRVCFKRDWAVYAQFLQRAADKGHVGAMRDLGYAYALGEGVAQDYAQAGTWLRKSGVEASPETNDYTLGYAWTSARLVRRYLNLSVPQWREHAHEFEVALDLAPQSPPARLEIRRTGAAEEAAVREGETLLVNVRAGADDAMKRSAQQLPPVQRERLSAAPYRYRWIVQIPRSGQGKDAAPVTDIDYFLAR